MIIFTNMSGLFFQRTLGAYQLAHFLRGNNYNVQVIDFTDHFSTEELTTAVDKFLTDKTIAIGISTTFYKNEDVNEFMPNDIKNTLVFNEFPQNVLDVIQYAKNKFPKIKVVVGGGRTDLLTDNPLVDKIIQGYAEDETLAYLDEISKRVPKIIPIALNGAPAPKPVFRKVFDIENLDHKFTEQDIVLRNETLPIEISRGCIFKCTFCAFPLNGKSKMDYLRDTGRIRDEMISNYEKFGTTNYFFGDDTFNDSTEKLERLHKMILTLPFKIKFTTYLRLDLLQAHQEQVPLLEEMGLASPFFGIETLNKKSGSSIGKGMHPEKVKEFLLQLEAEHWKKRIPIICSFIVGLPHETVETVTNTFNWIKNTPLNSVFFPLIINDKKFYKSEFTTKYKDFGYYLDRDTGWWSNEYFNYDTATDLANKFNGELSKKENYPSAWFMMALLNHGYSLEELLTTPIQKLSFHKILRAKQRNINEYKKRLLGLTL